ncbi:MAG: hypothetical protein ACOVSW_21255 [Candidatus Kapaibacteriota bacterium]
MRLALQNRLVKYVATAMCVFVLLVQWGCDFPTAQDPLGTPDFQTTLVRYVKLTDSTMIAPASPQFLVATFATYSAVARSRVDTTARTADANGISVTPFITPFSDTGRVTVREVNPVPGKSDFPPARIVFGLRGATYTIIGLPPSQKQRNQLIVDTILTVTALPSSPPANTANIRFVNCVNDSTKTYSLILGCPSGAPLSAYLRYRASSAALPIPVSGDNVVSLALTEQGVPISSTATAPPPVRKDLFNLRPLSAGNNYTILLYQVKGVLRLLALNDRNDEKITADTVSAPSTFVRVANLSGGVLESVLYGNNAIVNAVSNDTLTNYNSLTACASAGSDTLILNRRNGLRQQRLATSLEVNGSQTLLIGDSSAVAAPALTITVPQNSVAVRVVNLSSRSVSVFRGATSGMRMQALAENLGRGNIGGVIQIPRETLQPFMVFTTNSPQQVLQTSVDALPSRSTATSYFLVVQDSRMVFVPDESTLTAPAAVALKAMGKGALVHIVHAFADETNAITVSVGTGNATGGIVLSDQVSYGGSRLTVLPEGNAQFTIGGATSSMANEPLKSNVHYVAIGIVAQGSRQVIVERGLWTPRDGDTARKKLVPQLVPTPQGSVRYLNATLDVDSVGVFPGLDTSRTSFQLGGNMDKGKFIYPSVPFTTNQIRTLQFSYGNKIFYTAQSLNFSVGRAYTIIFSGRAKDEKGNNAYNVILLQEF